MKSSPEFFRLLYVIAKIASMTARIVALLDFISAVQYLIYFISFIDSFLTGKSQCFSLINSSSAGFHLGLQIALPVVWVKYPAFWR